MKTEVSIRGKAEVIKVFVDGRSVRLKNGEGATLVAAGERHALSWVVRGAPGSTYFIEITAPPEAKLRHSDTFDDDASMPAWCSFQ